jgi:alpha-L-arabinofuranosidase
MTLFAALLSLSSSQAPITLTIRADQPTVEVNPGMYGIFFEEINQAGEGGLYAELLKARGMEDGSPERLPSGWKPEGDPNSGSVSIDLSARPNPSRPHSLKIVRHSDTRSFGVANEGFWGIPLKARKGYRLTLWYRSESPVDLALVAEDGSKLAKAQVKGGSGWARRELTLTPARTDAKARLVVAPAKAGTVWLSFASLMPTETFRGRKNGLRPDLAQHIASMKPGFVRFPGGCYVEGNVLPQAFDWKKTIGPVETRDSFSRTFWGYPASNGLGYHEYLQWVEDMGSKALFVVNCGMSHQQVAAMEQMDRYVQDALDAIEYARGPVTSKWGALRAKNGHPKPFNLRYIQIGNENGGPNYNERFGLMAKAIKAKYPDIELVANDWGGTPTSFPLEIVDEHYYNSPTFFWRNANRYDRYERKGPKIYVGEYAVTQGSGGGNLAAALSEAAFMTGMERNADVVHMASYAPLFANVNNRQWNPNAIVFDNSRSYGTPSYWVQWLFATHRPDRVVKYEVSAPAPEVPALLGRVGLTTWRTQAEFKDLKLEADGRTVFDGSKLDAQGLQESRGEWTALDGVIKQAASGENRRTFLKGVSLPAAKKLVLSLKARKIAGDEGFIVVFGSSPDHELQWNLGGWENTVHAFQVDGGRTGRGVPAKIEADRWYDIRLEREGAVTRGYLNGTLIEQIVDQPAPDFAAVVGVDERSDELILKAVNGASHPRRVDVNLEGIRTGSVARGLVLSGSALLDENSLEEPDRIRPRPIRVDWVSPKMTLTLTPYSVTVLRIPRRK